MPLRNCEYDKVKLLHDLSCIHWFLEKHGEPDAKKDGDAECSRLFAKIKEDLAGHIDQLTQMVCK